MTLPRHASTPDEFSEALTASPPYPPGAEVWVVPEEEGYGVEKASVVSHRAESGYYVIRREKRSWLLPSTEVFPTELAALEDRRRYAAEVCNSCDRRKAEAVAFLGRPGT
jgi:hypothetical protein